MEGIDRGRCGRLGGLSRIKYIPSATEENENEGEKMSPLTPPTISQQTEIGSMLTATTTPRKSECEKVMNSMRREEICIKYIVVHMP